MTHDKIKNIDNFSAQGKEKKPFRNSPVTFMVSGNSINGSVKM